MSDPFDPKHDDFNNPYQSGDTPATEHSTELTSDEQTWGSLTHLSGLAGLVLGGIFGFVGPLILWQLKKNESRYLDDQGKEATNFQITMSIAYLVIGTIGTLTCFGFVFLAVPIIMQIVFPIMAAFKTNQGELYRYPLTARFIK